MPAFTVVSVSAASGDAEAVRLLLPLVDDGTLNVNYRRVCPALMIAAENGHSGISWHAARAYTSELADRPAGGRGAWTDARAHGPTHTGGHTDGRAEWRVDGRAG